MLDVVLTGISGTSASRRIMLGCASARILHAVSFADVLDERTGRGYQRRFDHRHSLDFRRYIQTKGSATIPLTFNLRMEPDGGAEIIEGIEGDLRVRIPENLKPLAQVDCQHRLGYLADSEAVLPFMCFLGLSAREEMEIFGVINGKARGLSRSLLDFHDTQLCEDLAAERPELLIALVLKNESSSPWFERLDLGGASVSGLERRASFRTMQKAAKGFLRRIHPEHRSSAEASAKLALAFWVAVERVVPHVFTQQRTHLVTKGIGVYALMELAAELVNELPPEVVLDADAFVLRLADFAPQFDWSSTGPLKGIGGEGGVSSALALIREARNRSRLRVAHG